MASVMNEVSVAIIILSPELIAKQWPAKELLFFLNRREMALRRRMPAVVILPVFYRLTVAEMYTEPDLTRKCDDGTSLYQKTQFFERMNNGDPEADINKIRHALQIVHGIQGVENRYHASNSLSGYPERLLLLEEVVQSVSRIMDLNQTPSNSQSG